LDECEDNVHSTSRSRKGKGGRKTSRRKSSKSKSSRPQRAAARNALNLFSKITGGPIEGEEDSLVGDSSDSDSTLQESNIDSEESGRASQNDRQNYSKGKEVLRYESEDSKPHELTESHVNRRRLVLKFPIRGSSKPAHEFENQAGLVGSSSKTAQKSPGFNGNNIPSSTEQGYRFGNGSYSSIERTDQVYVDLLEKIRWGEVRARSSKPLRVREAVPPCANPNSLKCPNHLNENGNVSTGHEKEDKDFSSTSTPAFEIQNDDKVDSLTEINENCADSTSQPFNPTGNGEPPLTASSNYTDQDETLVSAGMTPQDTILVSVGHSGVDQLPEPNIGFPSVSTKLRSKRGTRNPESPCKHDTKSSVLKNIASSCNADNNLNNEEHVVVVKDDNNTRLTSNQRENDSQEVDAQAKQVSTSHDSLEPHSNRDKMFKAVYRRSRSHKAVTNGSGMGESTSNGSNSNLNVAVDSNGTNEALHTNGSLELELGTRITNNEQSNLKVQQGNGSCMVRIPQSVSPNKGKLTEERGSNSNLTVGLRSTRNRRSTYNIRETSPVNRRKSLQSTVKGSWLLLSTHEEGCRYIPQQGDEVVYLRQVSNDRLQVTLFVSLKSF
jgi:PH-interacting protein